MTASLSSVSALLAFLVFFSGLTSLTRAAMSDQDCGEGRVRDLDGTCVKKVIIHTETKPVCPKLSIDNGNIFLFGGKSWGDRREGGRPTSITWPCRAHNKTPSEYLILIVFL